MNKIESTSTIIKTVSPLKCIEFSFQFVPVLPTCLNKLCTIGKRSNGGYDAVNSRTVTMP